MVKAEIESKGPRKRWSWAVVGALMAILVAVAMSSRISPSLSLFGRTSTPCRCAKYSGIVEDCCCDYETVDRLNEEVLHPSLQELVRTAFFRYFKVKLWCDCPFWPDDGMCRLRDCSVCECPDSEFPEPFKKPHYGLSQDDPICQEGKPQATVDRTIDSKAFRGWVETDNPWTTDDETDNTEMTYVNLQLNPERYTGYIGPSARRIWDAVYSENCPKYPSEESCQEEKIFYKLISGLHSSISIHIAADYLLDEARNLWGQNVSLMYDRVLQYPDRVGNLYFTFLFVLRAVTKAADYLEHAEYDTGNLTEDLKTQSSMRQLLFNPKLQAACPIPFDEAKLWKGQHGPDLKQKIQQQFRNIRKEQKKGEERKRGRRDVSFVCLNGESKRGKKGRECFSLVWFRESRVRNCFILSTSSILNILYYYSFLYYYFLSNFLLFFIIFHYYSIFFLLLFTNILNILDSQYFSLLIQVIEDSYSFHFYWAR